MKHGILSDDTVTIYFNPRGSDALTAVTVWRHQVAETLNLIRLEGGNFVRLSGEW